jgi:hypothetical protein
MLMAAGSIGGVSHLALDAITGANVGLLWPLSDTRFPVPLFAMADLWIAIPLTAAALVAWWTQSLTVAARATLVLLLLLAGLKSVALNRAQALLERTTLLPDRRYFEASWSSWAKWLAYERTSTGVRAWRIDAWRGTVDQMLEVSSVPDSTAIAASRSLATVRNLLSVHDYAFPVDEHADATGRLVRWSDLRFCWPADAPRSIDCALWFGGWIAPDGRPLKLLMQVGSWQQTRLPSE